MARAPPCWKRVGVAGYKDRPEGHRPEGTEGYVGACVLSHFSSGPAFKKYVYTSCDSAVVAREKVFI